MSLKENKRNHKNRNLRGETFHVKGEKKMRGGLMVSELDSGSSSPDSSPGGGHCVVFLGNKLHSRSASLHPKWVPANAGGNPAMD